jgi:cbb3-type cytochrome oxidase maturation protein
MNAIIILIPITLVLLGFAVSLFFWAVRHDQFRNLDTPEIVPLLDAEPSSKTERSS